MNYDVIVVLAGGIRDNGTLPQSVKQRVQKASDLYFQGIAPRILMSGRWSVYREKHRPIMTEAEAMARYAMHLGVPRSAILKEEQSNSTKSNAQYVYQSFLLPRRWKKLVVVTSDFHLARVRQIFSGVVGPEFEIDYEATSTNYSLIQRLTRGLKEQIAMFLHAYSSR